MTNIYNKLRLVATGRIPGWLKLAGLAAMIVARRRAIGIFIDPVDACNLRCRMCYFSDPDHVRAARGRLSDADIDRACAALFHRALKLQIGCGAEPTLDSRLVSIVERGRKAGIPFISLTTNGQLIADGKVSLDDLCAAGLSEITLSMHGTRPDTYANLMPGADFEKHRRLIAMLEEARRSYPPLSIRINFTVNSLNVHDLADSSFWDLWATSKGPDIVQLRPVQKIGNSAWTDFDLEPLRENFESTIGKIVDECRRRGITCIAPTRRQLDEVASRQSAASAAIEDVTYCFIGPGSFYKPDFRADDTFESYHRRNKTVGALLRSIVHPSSRAIRVSKKLNYRIK